MTSISQTHSMRWRSSGGQGAIDLAPACSCYWFMSSARAATNIFFRCSMCSILIPRRTTGGTTVRVSRRSLRSFLCLGSLVFRNIVVAKPTVPTELHCPRVSQYSIYRDIRMPCIVGLACAYPHLVGAVSTGKVGTSATGGRPSIVAVLCWVAYAASRYEAFLKLQRPSMLC